MAIIRWEPYWNRNPWSNLMGMQKRMNRAFGDLDDDENRETEMHWSPRVSIVELKEEFEVSVELPGMKRDDIKVELKENILTISGEKMVKHEKTDRKIHMSERLHGTFLRSFELPSTIKSEEIKADFTNGVLSLHLPKQEQAKPKEIEIKVD